MIDKGNGTFFIQTLVKHKTFDLTMLVNRNIHDAD